MTFNCVMSLVLHYFTEFVYNVVVKQILLGLPRFQNLLLIVYDHINTICAIIQRLFGQNKLITRFDGRRYIDDMISCKDVREPASGSQHNIMKLVFERKNLEVGSLGVGAGLYMYVVVVKSSRSLSHLLVSSCMCCAYIIRGGRPHCRVAGSVTSDCLSTHSVADSQ